MILIKILRYNIYIISDLNDFISILIQEYLKL